MADESDLAFNYPEDGCYARAHLMLKRITERYGVSVNKVWAFGNLKVNTSYGTADWEYHVAPIVTVTNGKDSQSMVIDPSIANGPVTKGQWWAIMSNESPSRLSLQTTVPGESPIDPSTKEPYPGSGYWPDIDPTTHGGLDGFSLWILGEFIK